MPATDSPLVSVVVLNYNGAACLGDCLRALARQDHARYEVIVVDNQSTDGSHEIVGRDFPQFRLLRLPANLGFCAGNHAGIRQARGAYIALVNNDAVVPPRFLSGLAETLQQHPRAWVAAPKVMNRNLDMSLFPRTGTLGVSGLIMQNVFEDPAAIFGAPGAALMYCAEAGLPFDEDYQYFSEDVSLSWRAWLAGREVVYRPDIEVEHLGSASFRKQPPWYVWLLERNRWLTLLCYFSGATVIKLAPLWLLALAAEWAGDLAAGRPLGPRVKAYAWLVGHARLVAQKRRAVQRQRQVADAEVLRLMSCRLTNQTTAAGRALNALAAAWCRAMNLRTWELGGGRA